MDLHNPLGCVLPFGNIYHLTCINSVPAYWPMCVATYCPSIGQHVLIPAIHLFDHLELFCRDRIRNINAIEVFLCFSNEDTVKCSIGCWLCSRVVGWQFRFSLYEAVTTKVLTMVVSLYNPLVLGSVEYPMPYASCLGCFGVLLSCASLSCSSGCSACPPVFSL